jgi:hypothetical protein
MESYNTIKKGNEGNQVGINSISSQIESFENKMSSLSLEDSLKTNTFD